MTNPVGAWARRIADDLAAAANDSNAPVEQLVDHLLAALANAGGALPSEDLVRIGSQALTHAPGVAAELTSEACERLVATPEDGRKSALAKAAAIGGIHVTWLTSAGWSAAGHTSKRERRPAPTSMTHRIGVLNLERWLNANLVPALDRHAITTSVIGGTSLREQQLRRAQALQRTIHALPDRAAAAPLLGGVFPDVMTIENWPPNWLGRRVEVWPKAWALEPDQPLDLQACWELELHSKAREALTRKISNHAAAAEALPHPWWHVVVWVVRDPRTWRDIERTITHVHQQPIEATPHYVVPSHLVGCGEAHPDVPLRWPEGQQLDLITAP